MLVQKFSLPTVDWTADELIGATDLVMRTLELARTGSVHDALVYIVTSLELDSYVLGIVANDRRPDRSSRADIVTNQSREWIEAYDANSYLEQDPRVELGAEPGFRFWEASQFIEKRKYRKFLTHAAEHGIRSGLVIGLCTRDPPSYALMAVNSSSASLSHWTPEHRMLIAAQLMMVAKILSRSVRQYLKERDMLYPVPLMDLTERELEILTLLASGFTSKKIAERYSNAKVTVDKAVRVIVKKMGALNRSHAIAIAVDRRIIKILDPGAAEFKSGRIRAIRGDRRKSFTEQRRARRAKQVRSAKLGVLKVTRTAKRRKK